MADDKPLWKDWRGRPVHAATKGADLERTPLAEVTEKDLLLGIYQRMTALLWLLGALIVVQALVGVVVAVSSG